MLNVVINECDVIIFGLVPDTIKKHLDREMREMSHPIDAVAHAAAGESTHA